MAINTGSDFKKVVDLWILDEISLNLFADSALYLSDLIYENNPVAELIVLSAAKPLLGKTLRGGDVQLTVVLLSSVSLLRLVIYDRWIANPLMSLQSFSISISQQGNHPILLCKKAKLEFIKSNDQSLLYYWSAPILTGKADVIEFKKSFGWYWVATGLCLILLECFALGKRMRCDDRPEQTKW